MEPKLLFNKYLIFDVVENQKKQAQKAVLEVAADTLLGASEDDLISAVVDKFHLNVPAIRDEDIHVSDTREVQVDVRGDFSRGIFDRSVPCYVPGNQTTISIPFAGDKEFFDVQPQIHTSIPAEVTVQESELILTYTQVDNNADALKQFYTRTLQSLKGNLNALSESATRFNAELPTLVRGEVTKRKQRLLDAAGMTAALGLPIKRRSGVPTTYAVPVQRKKPRIELPQVSGPFKPEPALSVADYEEILSIMRNMVRVMELSPRAFEGMGEEDLRWHFLVQLNAQFEGGATGETFNFQGKTDILIKVENKNVFVAECKFWAGEKQLVVTLDQLLSYLSWRDTKAAVLVFSRNANFSAVLEKISATVPTHPCFKRNVGRKDETTFVYSFRQPNDPNREVLLTVMAFDVPTSPKEQAGFA
jgi:hypothetical protein